MCVGEYFRCREGCAVIYFNCIRLIQPHRMYNKKCASAITCSLLPNIPQAIRKLDVADHKSYHIAKRFNAHTIKLLPI